MSNTTFLYLTAEELRHYQYMLNRGYEHKVVQLRSHRYIVFPVVDRPEVGIAWPTVTGKLDSIPTSADTVFDAPEQLQPQILAHLSGSTVRILLVPRYAG